MKNVLIVSLISLGSLAVGCRASHTAVYTVHSRPAPPRVVVRPPMPSPAHIWVNGDWIWNGRTYVWKNGYWMAPRPGHVWAPGKWQRQKGGWHWREGHWR